MTLAEFQKEVFKGYSLKDNIREDKELYVEFDFPLIPGVNKFKVVSIVGNKIVLKNEMAPRPLGHE